MTVRSFVGVQVCEGIGVLLLVNDEQGSTRALVAYMEEDPVVINDRPVVRWNGVDLCAR